MSTPIFSKLVPVLKNVVIFKKMNRLFIKGPLGVSYLEFPDFIFFETTEHNYRIFGFLTKKNLILTFYRHFQNKLKGVCLGFFELLTITGVGWRVFLQNDRLLTFTIGYSHTVDYLLQNNIEVFIYDKQHFKIFGLDLEQVQRVVTDLCKLRSIDVYKGKGVHKTDKVFKLKVSSKSKA